MKARSEVMRRPVFAAVRAQGGSREVSASSILSIDNKRGCDHGRTRRGTHTLTINRYFRRLAAVSIAGLTGLAAQADAATAQGIPIPKPRPATAAISTVGASPARQASPATARTAIPLPAASTAATAPDDIAAVKKAIALARAGKLSDATQVQGAIGDPLARKLVEWTILRTGDSLPSSRYAAFIAANPSWPSIGFLRRRAEAALWQERADAATVRAFFGKSNAPLSAKGHFALARALLAQGDRAGAQAQVREAWHDDAFSRELEDQALEAFQGLLTAADHKARMDMRLYAEDGEAAARSATRAGGAAPAIAKARTAVIKKAAGAKAALDAVPESARRDLGYLFSQIQWLRRGDKIAEAGALLLTVPREPDQIIDTDQWWIERRLVARKLLDIGDAKTAYRVARDAAPPGKENYRVEHQFTAGWIALRFLDDPATAQSHFVRMAEGVTHPIAVARAGYWQGRAAEALGRRDEARGHFERAAQHPTAYYGQLARARIGHKDIVLSAPPELSAERRAAIARLEAVRAVELLYAVGERDLVVPVVADLGDRSPDAAALAAMGEIAARNQDARAMLLLGKAALGRGLALEHYAFPIIGMPDYRAIGPKVEQSIVYAIARQESTFNQRTISSAKAMGLMQVTPAAGRHVAKKFGAPYDEKRLLSDPSYNVQLGAAELGELIDDYRGSYIMAFAGYNAGRGRVRDWIARYGDPRDPAVDPIDWVERIPFAETRNYVQRVLENVQVYRARFGGGLRLLIEADLRRGAATN
jgi:soluble lytic murein transglycosylase